MENVSWEDIKKFEARTGLVLPTEAHREYACGPPARPRFAGKIEDLGWFREDSGDETHPVGNKPPNDFGILDLHGNVSECCEVVFGDNFTPARVEDPDVPEKIIPVEALPRGRTGRVDRGRLREIPTSPKKAGPH